MTAKTVIKFDVIGITDEYSKYVAEIVIPPAKHEETLNELREVLWKAKLHEI